MDIYSIVGHLEFRKSNKIYPRFFVKASIHMGSLEPSDTELNVTKKDPGDPASFRTVPAYRAVSRVTSRARRQADASQDDMPAPAVSAREGATRRVWKRWSSSPLPRVHATAAGEGHAAGGTSQRV